jgi:hypothetical protein
MEVLITGDNSSASNCRLRANCLNGDCSCRNIFSSAQCGTITIPVYVYVLGYIEDPNHIENKFADNWKYAAWWLRVVGIADVQTMLNNLTIMVDMYCSDDPCQNRAYSWAIDIFPKLEVVRGTLEFRFASGPASVPAIISLLPGPGLANLRVTGRTIFTLQGTQHPWGMADLSFLPGLVCPGTQIDGSLLSNLVSLKGLERVADGNPALANQNCFFDFALNPSVLFNVSTLARFAGCGAKQRPDNSTILPCLNVWCGQLNTWSALCNYIASSNICS